MKKWMKITLWIAGGIILLFVIDLGCIFTINRPLFAIKKDNGSVYKGILYDTYNCAEYSIPQIKAKGTKFACAVIQFDEINIKDIYDKINNYFSKDNIDKTNMSYWTIDEDKNIVIVGMMNINQEKQNEFFNNVFSSDSECIQYIKDNKMIEFRESIDIFDAKIIEAKENTITVEVLEDSKSFKKNDKVTMKITRPTSGINDFYVVGNNVRITFNGMVETSNPAQIGATKIELIS